MVQGSRKKGTKRGVNMSFSELVQRLVQRNTNGAVQDLEEPKQKKVAPKKPRRRSK